MTQVTEITFDYPRNSEGMDGISTKKHKCFLQNRQRKKNLASDRKKILWFGMSQTGAT